MASASPRANRRRQVGRPASSALATPAAGCVKSAFCLGERQHKRRGPTRWRAAPLKRVERRAVRSGLGAWGEGQISDDRSGDAKSAATACRSERPRRRASPGAGAWGLSSSWSWRCLAAPRQPGQRSHASRRRPGSTPRASPARASTTSDQHGIGKHDGAPPTREHRDARAIVSLAQSTPHGRPAVPAPADPAAGPRPPRPALPDGRRQLVPRAPRPRQVRPGRSTDRAVPFRRDRAGQACQDNGGAR